MISCSLQKDLESKTSLGLVQQKSKQCGYPKVSVVVCTFNSSRILKRCLQSLRNQEYPQEALEIIVVDGHSTDSTVKIAESFGAKIMLENTHRPESATAIGYNASSGEFILNFPSDNVLPHKTWLQEMIEPFIEDEQIVAAQPLRYSYDKGFSILDRYFSIFGCGDPLAFYLGKRDNCSMFEDFQPPFDYIQETKHYFVVEFGHTQIPTIGANGYIVRANVMKKFCGDVNSFFHIDTNVDLIRAGYAKFAFVKTDILHLSGESLRKYFPKRFRYAMIYFVDKGKRRYHLYDSRLDRLPLAKFILFSVTFLQPTRLSIRAYRSVSDTASFLHIGLCFLTFMFYGVASLVERFA
jgi:glycosyltransferase involved in cell wall biosynthesis